MLMPELTSFDEVYTMRLPSWLNAAPPAQRESPSRFRMPQATPCSGVVATRLVHMMSTFASESSMVSAIFSVSDQCALENAGACCEVRASRFVDVGEM